MAQFKTYNLGLTIKQPLPGATGYFDGMDADTYIKISEHDHTGGGKGVQIGSNALAAGAVTLGKINAGLVLPVANGGTNATDAATARTNLGLVIGTNVQAYDADLTTLAAGGSGARDFLDLGASDSPTFTGLTLSGLTASRYVKTDGSKALATGSAGIPAADIVSTGTAWSPSVTPNSGSVSFSVLDAQVDKVSNFVHFQLTISITVTSGSPTAFNISTPAFAAADHHASSLFPARIGTVNNGVWRYAAGNISVSYAAGGAFSGTNVISIDGKFLMDKF